MRKGLPDRQAVISRLESIKQGLRLEKKTQYRN